jgi:hypothetical protein
VGVRFLKKGRLVMNVSISKQDANRVKLLIMSINLEYFFNYRLNRPSNF